MVPELRRDTLPADQWPLPPFSPIWTRAAEVQSTRAEERALKIAELNRRVEARKLSQEGKL